MCSQTPSGQWMSPTTGSAASQPQLCPLGWPGEAINILSRFELVHKHSIVETAPVAYQLVFITMSRQNQRSITYPCHLPCPTCELYQH